MSELLTVIAEFEVPEDSFQLFLEVCQYDAERSLADEEGCLDFVVLTPHDESFVVVLYEVYTGKDAFKTHEKTSHFSRFVEAIKTFKVKERRVRFHTRH